MKKILVLIVLIFSFKGYSQWTYSSGKSDFDGSYKTSSVYGSGGEFPYTKPLFVVNKFSDRTLNIYISNAGYSGCDGREIFFKFNNDEKIYKTEYVGNDSSSEIWFITSLKNIKDYDFIEKLKNSSSMSVRIKSDCGSEDYKFRLDGSTKALNYVLGKNWVQKEKNKLQEEILLKRKLLKEKKESDSLFEINYKKRKEERLLKEQAIKEKIKKERELEKEKILMKCKKYFKKYPGKGYDCFVAPGNIKLRKSMHDFENIIPVENGILLLIDDNFKNKVFYKVVDYNNFGPLELYVFKKDVKFIY